LGILITEQHTTLKHWCCGGNGIPLAEYNAKSK